MCLAVVIPALNASAELPATLRAVGGFPEDVLIADGGSTDETINVAATHGARVVCAPRGRGLQLRTGIAATRAPWLLLLHADTHLSPGWELAVRQHLSENPEEAGYFRFALRSADPRARRLERLVAWRCRVLGMPYGDQGLLISRTLLTEVGGVHPLGLMEDVDLIGRLGKRRLRLLDATAASSAVRWERDGWYRRSLRNLLCLCLWMAGVPETRVAHLYYN
jgi:rSAM/selenodomain-associated transferase 2